MAIRRLVHTAPGEILAAGAATPPTEIRLFKFGKIRTTKGEFLFDDKAAKSVLTAWQDYGNDLCFDYEHKAVDKDGRAGDGKAAGWFKLAIKDDGLYAVDIKWTRSATDLISGKEFRYFSPAFDYDPKTGRVLELINVALTNIPATKDLPALVAAAKASHPENNMALKKPAKKAPAKGKSEASETLATKTKKKVTETETVDDGEEEESDEEEDSKLDEDEEESAKTDDDGDAEEAAKADESEEDDEEEDSDDDGDDDDDAPPSSKKPPMKKSKKMAKLSKTAASALLDKLAELTGKDDPEEAMGALEALAMSHRAVETLSKKVERMETDSRKARVKDMVEDAIKCGKLIPVQRKQFVELGLESVKRLRGLLDTMPKKVRMEHDQAEEEDGAPSTASRVDGIDIVALGRDGVKSIRGRHEDDVRKIEQKLGVNFAAMAKAGEFKPLQSFLESPDNN